MELAALSARRLLRRLAEGIDGTLLALSLALVALEIGRASCRERV